MKNKVLFAYVSKQLDPEPMTGIEISGKIFEILEIDDDGFIFIKLPIEWENEGFINMKLPMKLPGDYCIVSDCIDKLENLKYLD